MMKMRKVSRLPTLLVLLAVTATLFTGVANADFKRRTDGDDSSGMLDLRSASHAHRSGLLVHSVETYEPWENEILVDGLTRFNFLFSYRGSPRRQLVVEVADDQQSLFAEMSDWRTGKIVGYAKVWRPDERSLRVEFPKRLLSRKLAKYRWSVSSGYHQSGPPPCGDAEGVSTACTDHVPDSGMILHDLKG